MIRMILLWILTISLFLAFEIFCYLDALIKLKHAGRDDYGWWSWSWWIDDDYEDDKNNHDNDYEDDKNNHDDDYEDDKK